MSTEKNVALINRVLELINDRNLDEAFELYDLDYIYHGPGGQELRGRGGIRGLWDLFLTAFPDLTSSVDEVVLTRVSYSVSLPATNRLRCPSQRSFALRMDNSRRPGTDTIACI
jgi:hypothetical protein